jgi:sugar/nucleoside kinase (ribokinase family)
VPTRPQRTRSSKGVRPRIAILGDLLVDVVLQPGEEIRTGTDVPGRVAVRAGGSGANTARWLGRLGAAVILICAVGRDPAGRALLAAARADGVAARVVRPAGARTGRIGVVLSADGERSFVADRGAADLLRPEDIDTSWLAHVDWLHLPGYSVFGGLEEAARRAIDLARQAGAGISVDLASTGPLLAAGRSAALARLRDTAPDILFATSTEAATLIGKSSVADLGAPTGIESFAALLDLGPLVVLKVGRAGAAVLGGHRRRPVGLNVPTRPVAIGDSTGAGDAFDAGFLIEWISSGAAAVRQPRSAPLPGGPGLDTRALRAARAGNRTARRHLLGSRRELRLL